MRWWDAFMYSFTDAFVSSSDFDETQIGEFTTTKMINEVKWSSVRRTGEKTVFCGLLIMIFD